MSTTSIQPISQSRPDRTYRAVLMLLILLNFGKTLTFIGAGQPYPESDGVNYWKMGIEFAHGDWLLRGYGWAFRPPGLPVYLAAMQTAFGRYAIVATTVLQLLLDFCMALVTAWMCAKAAGNRMGALVGLALSLCCVSRSCFMVYVLADNLLCVALTLYAAVLLAWLSRPSLGKAAALGLLLAAAMLLKPVAQPLWISTLALMAYKLWRSSALRRLWRHAIVLLIVLAALLAPWYVRNKIVFGEYFLVQFTGRSLWYGCHGRPTQMPVTNSTGPKNRALVKLLEGTNVDMQMASMWDIYRPLRQRGFSDCEADKMMEAAMVESILDHPFQYLAGRPLRFVWFWVCPKAWNEVPWGWFYYFRDLPRGWTYTFRNQPETYFPPGQVKCEVPFLRAANTAILGLVWHPNSVVFGLAALATAAGCVFAIRRPEYREPALAVASVLLVISLSTTFFGWPECRYRLPLEPAMIVAATPMLLSIGRRLGASRAGVENGRTGAL